jgi:polysaccharide biosynthesis/export protein
MGLRMREHAIQQKHSLPGAPVKSLIAMKSSQKYRSFCQASRLWVVVALLLLAVGMGMASEDKTYVLGTDDRIIVRVVDMEEFTLDPVRVDAEGYISLPVLGDIESAGKTVRQLDRELTELLKKDLLNPQVTVTVAEFRSHPVSVFGAVERPGVVQLGGPKTLWEAISEAGGLKHEVGKTIRVTRRRDQGELPLPNAALDPTGDYQTAVVEVASVLDMATPAENITLRPHDVVLVSRADVIYVVGDVQQPGGFVTKGGISSLEALTMAGGFMPHAAGRKASVLRLQDRTNQRRVIPVDLKAILEGRGEDIALKPDDILYVPHSGWKAFTEKTLTAAISIASGIAIYRAGWNR